MTNVLPLRSPTTKTTGTRYKTSIFPLIKLIIINHWMIYVLIYRNLSIYRSLSVRCDATFYSNLQDIVVILCSSCCYFIVVLFAGYYQYCQSTIYRPIVYKRMVFWINIMSNFFVISMTLHTYRQSGHTDIWAVPGGSRR